jgi:hypothetical protein
VVAEGQEKVWGQLSGWMGGLEVGRLDRSLAAGPIQVKSTGDEPKVPETGKMMKNGKEAKRTCLTILSESKIVYWV